MSSTQETRTVLRINGDWFSYFIRECREHPERLGCDLVQNKCPAHRPLCKILGDFPFRDYGGKPGEWEAAKAALARLNPRGDVATGKKSPPPPSGSIFDWAKDQGGKP